MSNNNTSKTPPPGFMNTPNNGMGMQSQPQMGAPNHQNQNLMAPPFMPNMQPPPMMNTPPFMNGPNNHFPMQNNNHMNNMPYMGMMPCPPQGQFGPQNGVGGNAGYNPMFHPGQGQVMNNAAQFNLSQIPAHILAQSIMNVLQQQPNMNMNMNVPNGQFCAPFPVQNMNQQLPMPMPNPSQVVPYGMNPGSGGPMFGFQGQVPQGMVPQNPMFSANPQMGPGPGNNQVRPQVDQNQKNMAPPNGNANAFVSPPFPSQQFQGNGSGSHNTHNSQPSAFTNSGLQTNPNGNTKTNVPNPNWKGSPGNNFKNRQNRGGFQGGFQNSKFHDINNGKQRTEFPRDHKGKAGFNNGRAGHFGLNAKEHTQEPKRAVNYTEEEIQQWREARKKNHPSVQKKQSKHLTDSKVDRVVLQRQLKEVLAKQAELGVEVAEVPSHFLKDSEAQGPESEGKNTFTDKRKFQNKFNKKSGRKGGRSAKKQKFSDKDVLEKPSVSKRNPTLLQKLLSADIKRDKSHLIQVFRFMQINSFFQDCPDKPLIYPLVVVKETGSQGDAEKYLHAPKDVPDNESGDDDDENETTVHINPQHKEPSSLAKRQCDNGVGIVKSEEQEEGEIID